MTTDELARECAERVQNYLGIGPMRPDSTWANAETDALVSIITTALRRARAEALREAANWFHSMHDYNAGGHLERLAEEATRRGGQ